MASAAGGSTTIVDEFRSRFPYYISERDRPAGQKAGDVFSFINVLDILMMNSCVYDGPNKELLDRTVDAILIDKVRKDADSLEERERQQVYIKIKKVFERVGKEDPFVTFVIE